MKVVGRKHGWKDLRLCCHDIRPLFLKRDPLFRTKVPSLIGPFKSKANQVAFLAGLRMLEESAPLEDPNGALRREDVPCLRIDEQGQPVEYTLPGYVHTPSVLATAFIYGRWAHSTRAVDLHILVERFGEDSAFESVTHFCYKSGHGLLAVLAAVAHERQGTELPVISPEANLVTNINSVVASMRILKKTLTSDLGKLSRNAPKSVHLRPF